MKTSKRKLAIVNILPKRGGRSPLHNSLYIKDDKMVVTNGFKLIEVTNDESVEKEYAVPREVVQHIHKSVDPAKEVHIDEFKGKLKVVVVDEAVSSCFNVTIHPDVRPFPKYKNLFRKKATFKTHVDPKALIDMLKHFKHCPSVILTGGAMNDPIVITSRHDKETRALLMPMKE